MKTKINGLIVVEGITDISFLSSFLDASFYSVNGSAVNKNDVEFLKQAQLNQNIIILTDPDYPGTKIRNYLNENIPNCYNAYINKEVSIKRNKVGVAESTKEEVLKALNSLILFKNDKTMNNNLSYLDLFDLGLIGKENSKIKRVYLCNYLKIGVSNGKALLKKLNMLNLTKEKILEVLNIVND